MGIGKSSARKHRSGAAGPSRWHLFALGSISTFLLGVFSLGQFATRPQAVVELRLANTASEPAASGIRDPAIVAGELAAGFRQDPTRPDDPLWQAGARVANSELSLLSRAEITFDRSQSTGPIVRIVWNETHLRALGMTDSYQASPVATFASAGHAYAKAITDHVRQHATSLHAAKSKELEETTAAIDRLEQGLGELMEQLGEQTQDVVTPVSYQVPSAHDGAQRRPVNRPNGLMINEFAAPSAEQLRDQLVKLHNRRQQLLSSLPPMHPDVLELERQIADLGARLDQLSPMAGGPRFHDVSAEMPNNAASQERINELTNRLETLQHKQASLISEWHSRMGVLTELKRDRDALLQAQRLALQDSMQMARLDLASVESVSIQNEIIPRRWGILAMCLLGCAIIAGGSLTAWGARCQATFGSADELRKSLGVPIIGTLVSTEAGAVSRESRRRVSFRRMVFVCEMFLIVAAIWVAMVAIADGEFRGLLVANPLQAIIETAPRSWHLLIN